MTPRRSTHTGLMVFMLVISGNPAASQLTGGPEYLMPIVAAILGLAIAVRRLRVFEPRVVQVMLALLAIQIVQCISFNFWPVVTIAGVLTRLFVAAAMVALVEDLPAAYVRAITVIAVYCLVMWTIDQVALVLHLDFRGLFDPLERAVGIDADHKFVGIYTFSILDGTRRNSGIFREPGLFAGYLLIGLLWLMLDRSGVEPRVRRRRIAILLVALATTFSTAGYVTAPLVLAAVAFQHRPSARRSGPRTGVFLAVLAASVGGVWLVGANSTFLQDKVLQQYSDLLYESHNYEITRFGAALLDLNAIQERPAFGWGVHESTKFAQTPELAERSPSGGVTGFARSFGLLGFAVLVLAIAAGLRPLVGGNFAASVYITAVLVVIAQPNTFLNYPMFYGLLFLRRPLEHRDQVVTHAEPVGEPGQRVIDPGAVPGAQ